jgi:hypothetical protein
MTRVTIDQPANITPGDIYEDCAFHPVLCTLSITDVIAAPCLPVRVGRRAASSLADSGAGGRSR